MAEYIERVALTSGIDAERERNKQKANGQLDLYGIGYNNGLAMAATMIITAPAADLEVVKHGRWEKRFCHKVFGYYQYICSECKDDEYWNNNVVNRRDNYCPNCGAKMDGVEQIIGEGHNETKVWG